MLQVCKFCKYEPPSTCILKHFPQVFNHLSPQVLIIYTYTGINICLSIFNMHVKKLHQTCSVIPQFIASKKPRGSKGIMQTLFISTIFFDSRICLHQFFSLVFSNHQQLLQSLVKGKNVLSSKIKFTKRNWISKKNKNAFYYSIQLSFVFKNVCHLRKMWRVFTKFCKVLQLSFAN